MRCQTFFTKLELRIYFSLFLGKRKDFLKALPFLSLFWILIFIAWFALRSIALGQNPVSYKLVSSFEAVIKNFPAVFLFIGKIFVSSSDSSWFNSYLRNCFFAGSLFVGGRFEKEKNVLNYFWGNMVLYLFTSRIC